MWNYCTTDTTNLQSRYKGAIIRLNMPSTRREFLIGAGAVLASACTNSQIQSDPQEFSHTPELPPLEKLRAEVRRLALQFPSGSYVRQVYTKNLSVFSGVFTPELYINFVDPQKAYTRVRFGNAKYTPEKRIRYIDDQGTPLELPTLTKLHVMFYASSKWLETQSDEVKRLALEKEAAQVALWKFFSEMALFSYVKYGKIEIIDQKVPVTREDIAQTLHMHLQNTAPEFVKLEDYAGYLAVMPSVWTLVESGNKEALTELRRYTNLLAIYEKAITRGIPVQNLQFDSHEFRKLAFTVNSPWAQMILDPSTPGPR